MNSWRLTNLLRMLDAGTTPYTTWFKNMKAKDWEELMRFFIAHDHLDRDQYQYQLNRYFLEFELRNKRPLPPYPEQVAEILGNMNVKREA